MKEKENRVVELRLSGQTWKEIAEMVGYSNHTGAFKAYQRATTNEIEQEKSELLLQEIDRLDALQVAVWPSALAGDTRALGIALKIIESRVKLLGLSAQNEKPDFPDLWDEITRGLLNE